MLFKHWLLIALKFIVLDLFAIITKSSKFCSAQRETFEHTFISCTQHLVAPVRTFCHALSQANLETLQKTVSEIRIELAQRKSENQADGAPAANNSTPNLSPAGGTTAARDDARQGKDRLNISQLMRLGLVLIQTLCTGLQTSTAVVTDVIYLLVGHTVTTSIAFRILSISRKFMKLP